MTNKPFSLTDEEIKEVAAVKAVQELWGEENSHEMEKILNGIYTVRFDYMSGGPGYVGDLFIIQSDVLGDDHVVRLIRNRRRELELVA